ncbi:hypothetical protein GGS20DRAFT_573519 [Poronia punctata]|nr:hypothetical protein GGS20DRAFT_573519 [Poronia punctata]
MASCKENQPFLVDNERACQVRPLSTRRKSFKQSLLRMNCINGIICVFHVGMLIGNIILLFKAKKGIAARFHDRLNDWDERAFSPAQSSVRYHVQFLGQGTSQFIGEPRPELDQAWSHLLRPTMVKVSNSEMERMNKTSILFKDGSGYLGYLEAHHMLHCVKRLYQSHYPDAYPEERKHGYLSKEHQHHCLEVLREGIMCNADVSINTYFWKDTHTIKGDRSGARRCTDWNRIQDWAEERSVKYSNIDDFLAGLVQVA